MRRHKKTPTTTASQTNGKNKVVVLLRSSFFVALTLVVLCFAVVVVVNKFVWRAFEEKKKGDIQPCFLELPLLAFDREDGRLPREASFARPRRL